MIITGCCMNTVTKLVLMILISPYVYTLAGENIFYDGLEQSESAQEEIEQKLPTSQAYPLPSMLSDPQLQYLIQLKLAKERAYQYCLDQRMHLYFNPFMDLWLRRRVYYDPARQLYKKHKFPMDNQKDLLFEVDESGLLIEKPNSN